MFCSQTSVRWMLKMSSFPVYVLLLWLGPAVPPATATAVSTATDRRQVIQEMGLQINNEGKENNDTTKYGFYAKELAGWKKYSLTPG